MNILLLNYEFPPLGGGGGIFSRDLARELAKEHNVDVLTSHFPGLKKQETSGGLTVYRTPVVGRKSPHTATMSSLLSFPISGIIKGLRLLREKKYDIINTHFAVPTGPAGLVLSRISGTPNVLNVFGGDIYDPTKKMSPHRHALLRWTVRNVIRKASQVVTESANIASCAETFYRPAKDITIIPLGLAEPRFTPKDREALSLKRDKLYLISVGRLIKRKGYDFLITAFASLIRGGLDAELILIGDGPERSALEGLARELDVPDGVKFLGAVSDEEKFQYLSAADIYVLSSLHEGFGIVLLEAMSCGLPVVATNKGGQTDIIRDGKEGTLVPPADAESLADAIHKLATDPDRMKRVGISNRQEVKKYAMPVIAKKYIGLFREILKPKPNR
ncbi:glycosyltransferase [Candidatus Omnitrophota bacterium]